MNPSQLTAAIDHPLYCPPDQVPAEGQTLFIGKIHSRSRPDYRIDHDTGCWEWLKGKTKRGYPYRYAHRRYFQRANPTVDITGLDIHHKCENPGCVNPDHLEAKPHVTHLEEHKRAHAKLTLEQVREIRASPLSARELGEKFGVKMKTVENVRYGVDWKGVGELVKPVRYCKLCGAKVPDSRRRSARYCSPEHARQASKLARAA